MSLRRILHEKRRLRGRLYMYRLYHSAYLLAMSTGSKRGHLLRVCE
jgi:hypothetical protein